MENSSVQIVLGSSQPVVAWPTLGRYSFAKLQSRSLYQNRKNSLIRVLTLLFASTSTISDVLFPKIGLVRFDRSPSE